MTDTDPHLGRVFDKNVAATTVSCLEYGY